MKPLAKLRKKIDYKQYIKIERIDNESLHRFLAKYISLLNPSRMFVCTDRKEDEEYVKMRAIESGEERPLKLRGYTVHFDNYYDQARDRRNTKILIEGGARLSLINTLDRETGLTEMLELIRNIITGKGTFYMLLLLSSKRS